MGKEYEIQILDVNVAKMRKIIKENKGKKFIKIFVLKEQFLIDVMAKLKVLQELEMKVKILQ